MNNVSKKLFHLVALAILPFSLMAQQNPYTINGEMGKLKDNTKVYLFINGTEKRTIDSAFVKKGAFQFKGDVLYPTKSRLVVDHQGVGVRNISNPDFKELYLEKGVISISTPDSMIRKADIKGSTANADFQKYRELLTPAEDKYKSLSAFYYAASEEKRKTKEFQEDMDKRADIISNEISELNKQYLLANPNSIVSLEVIKSIGGSSPDVAIIEPLFAKLSDQVRNSIPGKLLADNIAKLKKIAVGAIAPDFTQNTADQKPVKLSDFKGKYVLIDFWASWCGPCRAENPNVVKAFNQYKDKNFTVLGVSLDSESSKAAWLKAIEKDGLTWTQVSDLKGWSNAVAQMYSVNSIPQNFLINPEGKIVAKNLRGEALEAKLKEIFN